MTTRVTMDHSAMGDFKIKVNQKIAVFLGDYEDERKPEGHPSPLRPFLRVLFLMALLAGFVVLLVYYFVDSPDVRVDKVQQLGQSEKHYDDPILTLYNYSWRTPTSQNGTFNESYYGRAGVGFNQSRIPHLSCPCTTTSIEWRKFVRFYALTQNSTDWNITLSLECDNPLINGSGPCVEVPPRNDYYVSLLQSHIAKDPIPLNGNPGNTTVCDSSTLWNLAENTFMLDLGSKYVVCYWLASMLFDANGTGIYSQTSSTDTRSTEILETPTLLDRETFFMSVAQNAREGILKRRLKLNELRPTDNFVQKYYNGVADYLTELLDRGELIEPWQSFYEGAYYLQENVDVSSAYDPSDTVVFFVGNSEADPVFLHVEVDWIQYYDTCAPAYCEKTKNLKTYNQVIWAFATVGGLSTIVIFIATRALWPAVALLLGCFFKKSPVSNVKSPDVRPEA